MLILNKFNLDIFYYTLAVNYAYEDKREII